MNSPVGSQKGRLPVTVDAHLASPGTPRARGSTSNHDAAETSERAFAQRLLKAEASAIAAISDGIGEPFHRAVGLIVSCSDGSETGVSAGGSVLVTGLGKSGLIGAKISATLASLGIPSHFVHPSEAAHGDLGRFRRGDICIALSYSGETDEVVNLAAMLRQDEIPVIALTRGPLNPGTPDSPGHAVGREPLSSLDRLATVRLWIGPCDDAALTPAPTCSTTAMLALGDALALCAARRREFTDDDFAKRHPGGSLGGQLRPVREILRFVVGKNVRPVPDDLTGAQALTDADISGVRRPGALLLVSRQTGALTGILTDADIRRTVLEATRSGSAQAAGAGLGRPVRDLMTANPGTLPDTALVRDAIRMVRESRHDEVPVIDAAGRPIGILDVQDLITLKVIQSE